MRLVVADTAPLNYLVLIGQVELLSALFEKIFVPEPVWDELRHAEAPDAVRQWVTNLPLWIEVVASGRQETDDPTLEGLDDGERAAIELAVRIGADLILMDDRDGVTVARSKGFAVTGTLGILDLAARRDLIRLDESLERLRATSFRCRPEIMDALLAKHSAERKDGR
jgi:predicted nucleic acid-binding protein